MGTMKINNYQVFEKIRPGLGGGLLTAIKVNLNPVLISPCNEDAEILVVQCQVNDQKIRIINGYGPQDDDELARRLDFWMSLEREIISAKDNNCLVLVQLDANAKVGRSVILSDPNQTSENGKLLLEMLERENLFLQNISAKCKGVITRQRFTKHGVEQSVLDYIITCEKLQGVLEEMLIDEDQTFSLMKYASAKGTKKIVKSDHNVIYASFDLQYQNINFKKPRSEFFNLKNKECQEVFSTVTDSSIKFQKCFQGDKSFPEKCKTFLKSVDDTLHQCFRKIRVGKTKESPEIQKLLDEKSNLQILIGTNINSLEESEAKSKITEIETLISILCAKKNCEMVKQFTSTLGNGNFSQAGMWKLKNQLVPKEMDPPMAKQDKRGNLITAPAALKNLYLETYVERLRPREIKPNLISNYLSKVELWELRFSYLKTQKTSEWSEADLDGALKTLKSNKSRDPAGLINDIFKPAVIGKDLKFALLNFLNGIKSEFYFPTEVLKSNITSIYKRKGSRLSMENDRGIFGLSVYKKMIDKLIYLENIPSLMRI